MKTKQVYWLSLALAAVIVTFAPIPLLSKPSIPGARIYRVEAGQYVYSPAEIFAYPGDEVTIELVATDVVHGLYIDGYGLSISADPGQAASLTFIADKTGSFRLRCNVTCGAMHPFMIGKLKVGADAWLYRSFGLAIIGVLSSLVPLRMAKEHG